LPKTAHQRSYIFINNYSIHCSVLETC